MASTLVFFFFFFLLNFEVSFAHMHFVSKIPLKHFFVYVIYFMLGPRYRVMGVANGPRKQNLMMEFKDWVLTHLRSKECAFYKVGG